MLPNLVDVPSALGDAEPATPAKRPVLAHDQAYGEEGIFYSLMAVAERAAKGRLDPEVRAWGMRRLAEAENPKGALERARILHKAMMGPFKNGRWVPDPTDAEFMPQARDMVGTCKEGKIEENGACTLGEMPPFLALGDCFPEGTLVLKDGNKFVPVEWLEVGDKIWGLDRWSTVQATAAKGNLSIDAIRVSENLTDGSALMLTPDHHVYVLDCMTHPLLTDGATEPRARYRDDETTVHCECSGRIELRCRVSELRVGMMLSAPKIGLFGSVGPKRVKEIKRGVTKLPCWDIQTDDHRVYLPESGVTVSQCDDLSIPTAAVMAACMMGAAAAAAGTYCAIVGHAYDDERHIQHVLCAVYGEGRWWHVDPSYPQFKFGTCNPYTRERAIYVPSLEVACDAEVCLAPGGRADGPPPPPRKIDFVGLSGLPPLAAHDIPPEFRPYAYLAGLPQLSQRAQDAALFVRGLR